MKYLKNLKRNISRAVIVLILMVRSFASAAPVEYFCFAWDNTTLRLEVENGELVDGKIEYLDFKNGIRRSLVLENIKTLPGDIITATAEDFIVVLLGRDLSQALVLSTDKDKSQSNLRCGPVAASVSKEEQL